MANLTQIKSNFQTGDIPTEANYSQLIEELSPHLGANIINEADDFSHGTSGEWSVINGATIDAVNEDSIDILLAGEALSGLRKLVGVPDITRNYFYKLSVQIISAIPPSVNFKVYLLGATGVQSFSISTSESVISGYFKGGASDILYVTADESTAYAGVKVRLKKLEIIDYTQFENLQQGIVKSYNIVSAFNDLSSNLVGGWAVINNATNLAVVNNVFQFTTAANNYSGIRLLSFLQEKEYYVEIKARRVSGTAEPMLIGYPLHIGEYFEFYPTIESKVYSGVIKCTAVRDLWISSVRQAVGSSRIEVSDLKIIEINDNKTRSLIETKQELECLVGDVAYNFTESSYLLDLPDYLPTFKVGNRWGYGFPVGVQQNFNAIKFTIKASATLSRFKVTIQVDNQSGAILAVQEIAIKAIADEVKTLVVAFDRTIANISSDQLFITILSDGEYWYEGYSASDAPFQAQSARLVSNDSYTAANFIDFAGVLFHNAQFRFGTSNNRFDFTSVNKRFIEQIKIEDDALFEHNMNLRKWHSEMSKTGNQINVGFFGDSWVAYQNMTGFLANMLWNKRGFSGTGLQTDKIYLGYNEQIDVGNYIPVISYSGFVRTDQAVDSKGLFLIELISNAIGSTINYEFFQAEEISLFYYRQPGGGSFTYSLNGATPTVVSTDGVAGVQKIVLNNLVIGTKTLVISTTTADEVIFCGASSQNYQQGIVFHCLGNGSTNMEDYLLGNAQAQQMQLVALDLDLIFILDGTNEQGANVNPELYTDMLGLFIDRIKSGLPYVDIVLCSSPDNNRTGLEYNMRAYDKACLQAAINNNVGYISTYKHFGDFRNNPNFTLPENGEKRDAYGMYDEFDPSFHLSDEGALRFAEILFRYL